jgi:regulator of sigma E protease
LIFGALIFFHELGHFIMARLNKIDVEEFGIGYPPRMAKLFTRNGTIYSINWIPFGGFTRMKGENADATEPGSFSAANAWRRFLVLMTGPIMNLLLGMLVLAYLFSRTGVPDYSRVEIQAVSANSPAAVAGLQALDIVYSINQVQIKSLDQISQLVASNLGKPVEVVVQRNGQSVTTTLTPRANPPQGEGALGIVISNPVLPTNFVQAIPVAAQSTLDQGRQLILLPYQLIKGQISPEQGRLVSVVGIYDIFSQVQTQDQAQAATNPQSAGLNTLYFIGVISIALGYTNLLPIPALDGGHILFLLPEMFFKKKIRPGLENAVNLIGLALLMGLMVVLVINDIVNPVVIP